MTYGGPGEYGCCFSTACEWFIDLPFYLWKPPPPTRIQAIPLPPVTPSYETWDHSEDDGVNYDGEYENYPRGGPYNHQPTQRWTTGLDQEAESSTNLATAEPGNRGDETRSEVSFFTPLKIILSINGLDNS